MKLDSDFGITLTLGLIVRANADDLQELLNHIRDRPELFIVYKMTSTGKITIVDED